MLSEVNVGPQMRMEGVTKGIIGRKQSHASSSDSETLLCGHVDGEKNGNSNEQFSSNRELRCGSGIQLLREVITDAFGQLRYLDRLHTKMT